MDRMPLPSAAAFIMDRLYSQGYSVCAVGGCVRDFLLGRDIGDYDMTTSATPEQIKALFSDCQTLDTGIKHGTVSICIDRNIYEVTTYRTDGAYKDNRHPDSVRFTRSLAEDLARRDFTVNAICYSPYEGYTDLYGGMEDLSRRLIRAVGEADRRFGEDALRIMRAIRFSSVLDFDIERKTSEAVHEKRFLLTNIAAERIYAELKKLVMGKRAYRVLGEYKDVIAVFLPELTDMRMPEGELFDRGDFMSRMLSLFYLSCDKPEEAYDCAMRRLRCDNSTRLGGCNILRAAKGLTLDSERAALFALMLHGEGAVRGALSLGKTLGKFGAREESVFEGALKSGVPYKLSDLDIRGGDISALGFSGARIGECLDFLLRSVIYGECVNERAALISHLSNKMR